MGLILLLDMHEREQEGVKGTVLEKTSLASEQK